MSTPLPYTDTKPKGAADFYFAINATFRFLLTRLGRAGWVSYLRHLGEVYYQPVNQAWKEGGLPAIAAYWRAFFDAEPGAEVAVSQSGEAIEIRVSRCPAIHHLRQHQREIVPSYCQHCYYLGTTRAQAAGYAFELEGGNGTCLHRYLPGNVPVADETAALEKITPC